MRFVLITAAAALAACAAAPSPAARAARADTLAIRRALRAVRPNPLTDSVVSLRIHGDTAWVETSHPIALVFERLRGEWIPRQSMAVYESRPPLGLQPQGRVPQDTARILPGIRSGYTMPVYPGDTATRDRLRVIRTKADGTPLPPLPGDPPAR